MDRFGDMLRAARERAGLTQEVAAEAAGVNRVILAYYETGRRQVPLTAAALLSRLYGTSLEGLLFRAAPRELSDRAQAGLRLFEVRLTEYAELAAEMGVTLPGLGRSPLSPSHTATAKEAAWAARSLRHHLDLGGGAIADPFHALDEHALIWRLPLGLDLDQAPSGFFYNHPQAGFCIAVNSQMTLGRQVFTLAHELAHAYFHSQDADVVVSMPGGDHGRERFADAFAGEFLVPGDELRRVAAPRRSASSSPLPSRTTRKDASSKT